MSDDSLTSITFMTCQTTSLQSKFKTLCRSFSEVNIFLRNMKLVEALSLFNPKNKPKSLLAISAYAFPGHMSGASIVIVI